jgi:hypothetical protein
MCFRAIMQMGWGALASLQKQLESQYLFWPFVKIFLAEDADAHRILRHFYRAVQRELLFDGRPVFCHCLGADTENVSDLTSVSAVGDQPENLFFPFSQVLVTSQVIFTKVAVLEIKVYDCRAQFRTQYVFIHMDFADRIDNLFQGCVF